MYKNAAIVIFVFALSVFSQTGGSSSGGSSGGSSSGGSGQQGSSGSGGNSSGGTGGTTPSQQPVFNQQSAYEQMMRQRIEQQRVEDSFARLRLLSEQAGTLPGIDRRVIGDINAIYRKSSKKDLATVSVNPEDKAKYAAFLSDKNTGLIKLVPNINCSEDNKVISANEECLKYSVPGAGIAYSFRAKDYKIRRLSDLVYTGESFQANGVLAMPVMTVLGDIPLESVTLQTPALSYLVNFNSEIKPAEAAEIYAKLSKGFSMNGQDYGRGFKAAEDMTYALRSIAYNGVVPRAVGGFTYNELGFDKRKDILVVFRIVRKENDGSVILLWRELSRKDAPKMKQSEKIREGFQVVEEEQKKKKNER